jgi:hypothetical protein
LAGFPTWELHQGWIGDDAVGETLPKQRKRLRCQLQHQQLLAYPGQDQIVWMEVGQAFGGGLTLERREDLQELVSRNLVQWVALPEHLDTLR